MTAVRQELAALPFHRRYLALVGEIEREFPVALWKCGDADIWPLARMALYLDMYWANAGGCPPASRPLPLRAAERLATPLVNLWKSRRDLRHWVARPRSAHAILLGDGVSLDRVEGSWRDRYGEPLIAALNKRGLGTFLMQDGDLSRLPWHRPTYAANVVSARGSLMGLVGRHSVAVPEHPRLLQFIADNGERAPSLGMDKLTRRARVVLATAAAFERVLRITKPRLAFVVAYYAGLGSAYVLACRRQGILSIDLQHCPQDGLHKAYGWSAPPRDGYTTLPALFWNWTAADAAYIGTWADTLELPWHRSLYGGNTQLSSLQDDSGALAVAWNAGVAAIGRGATFEREILVALQPVGGYREQWDALAAQIEAAPPTWRWWIRRHPAARAYQDPEFGRLLSLRQPNVVVDEALSLPLPALLQNMSVVLSQFSGASAEAAAFGVPALFLSEAARGQFSGLIQRGLARVVDVQAVISEIAALPISSTRRLAERQPDIAATLLQLEQIAGEYSQLCRNARASDRRV